MARRTMLLLACGILALGLFVAASWNLYYIRDDSGGVALWNNNEAYLFMGIARRGFRLRLVDYPLAAVSEWLNAPAFPTDQRAVLTVIKVAPSGVERYMGKVSANVGDMPDLFTPIGGAIYANCKGSLCKWMGDHFEIATAEEQKKLGGINHLVSDGNTMADGWSKVGIGPVAGDSQLSIDIRGGMQLRIRLPNIYKGDSDSPLVELYRSGQRSEELWHVNGAPRRVNKDQYKKELDRD